MIGTIANTIAIFVGSIIGGLSRKAINEKMSQALLTAMGWAAFGIGINSVVQNMPKSKYPVLFIASLAIGVLIGTLLDLDGRVQRLTSRRQAKRAEGTEADAGVNSDSKLGSSRLGEGLITGCLLYCIGALSILGPVQAALHQDYTFLFTNASLDLVTSMVLAATYGIGMCIAAAVLFCWQGSIYALTLLLGDFITTNMMTELSIVGGFLIAMSGLSILQIKDCKTLNFLPSLIVPIVWCLFA